MTDNAIVFPKQKARKEIPTYRQVECPGCHKPRLLKLELEDGTIEAVSDEVYTAVDKTERPYDVCLFCVAKWKKRDEAFVRAEVRKLQKAAEQGDDVDIAL